MTAAAFGASRSSRRWAGLLFASAVLHALVLGGFAFRMPAIGTLAEAEVMDVTLVAPPPFLRQMRADESGPAGDQQPHPSRSVSAVRIRSLARPSP